MTGSSIVATRAMCSQATVATYAYVLGAFAPSLAADFQLVHVSTEHVNRFLQQPRKEQSRKRTRRKRAAATQSNYNQRLRVFFSWCVESGLVKDNPVPKVTSGTKRQRQSKQPEYFTEEQLDALLRVIEMDGALKPDIADDNRWLLDAVEFAAGTGMRLAEICNLRWRAIERRRFERSGEVLEAQVIRVEVTSDFSPKSGRERIVPPAGTGPGSRRRSEGGSDE